MQVICLQYVGKASGNQCETPRIGTLPGAPLQQFFTGDGIAPGQGIGNSVQGKNAGALQVTIGNCFAANQLDQVMTEHGMSFVKIALAILSYRR
jgi:hypothetical protein